VVLDGPGGMALQGSRRPTLTVPEGAGGFSPAWHVACNATRKGGRRRATWQWLGRDDPTVDDEHGGSRLPGARPVADGREASRLGLFRHPAHTLPAGMAERVVPTAPSNNTLEQTRHGQNGASLLNVVLDGPDGRRSLG
jgi:hypothetical protein